MKKTYTELMQLKSYEERFAYLKTNSKIGEETLGQYRYLIQEFYKSGPWLKKRDEIFIRDNGCDLGIDGREIEGTFIVHHINPVSVEDILNHSPALLDDENLISSAVLTHKAIHYSDESILITAPVERKPNDTCPWKN